MQDRVVMVAVHVFQGGGGGGGRGGGLTPVWGNVVGLGAAAALPPYSTLQQVSRVNYAVHF